MNDTGRGLAVVCVTAALCFSIGLLLGFLIAEPPSVKTDPDKFLSAYRECSRDDNHKLTGFCEQWAHMKADYQ